MFEQRQILKKIEQWAERLPYKTLKIEVELSNQTLIWGNPDNAPLGSKSPHKRKVIENVVLRN